MADFLKNILGGGQAEKPAVVKPDSDFADFAGAPDPTPEAAPIAGTGGAPPSSATAAVPYTKWYNVHERHSISEFKSEGVILVIGLVIVVLHIIGARANRSKARAWMRAHAPLLKGEYALVGFGGVPNSDKAGENTDVLLKEKSLTEFVTYATGRQNTAFADIKITLTKRYNPIVNIIEHLASFAMESAFEPPQDSVDAIIYPFDGKENDTVPSMPGSAEARAKDGKSNYDAFVFAIVNKNNMKQVRDERYDLSLTTTKDNAKLANWLTVMSESAEITNALLTDELAEAVKTAGDAFEYLIITDQPSDKPKTLKETVPSKRILLKHRLTTGDDYKEFLPLFSYFNRLPDVLVQTARFRPEVLKKVRATREAMEKDLRKVLDDEKAEERLLEKEKLKKAKRDAELAGLNAKAQKKYLEKEKEKDMRKAQKKQTMRG